MATSGGPLTVAGLNFRTSDLTVTASYSYQDCATASWASKTSVACAVYVGPSVGQLNDVGVTASGVVGTRTGYFTFDGSSSCLQQPGGGSA